MEPYNAILDLLGSSNPGVFRGFELHQDMLLKTDWVDRLGGEAKVEEIRAILASVFRTKNGLELHDLDSEYRRLRTSGWRKGLIVDTILAVLSK